jgi:hypothetical protein
MEGMLMKKVILGILVLIVIAIAVIVTYVLSNIDSLVKTAIEVYGSQATQTDVRVNKVHIELRKGSGSIQGLTVGNPKGFSEPNVFSLGEISTTIDVKSLAEQPYVIDTITVHKPEVFVEVNKDKQINLNELKQNLQPQKPAKAPQASEEKKEPRLIIRHVLFDDGTVNATVVPLKNKKYQLALPTLKLDNLGGANGATPSELSREILNQLVDRALVVVKEKGINAEVDKLKSQAQEKLESEKSKLKEETGKQLQEQKNKAEEKLKGMLK